MIRRGIWLGVGAVLGIAGYRRVSRMVQSVAPKSPAVPLTGRQISDGNAPGGANGSAAQLPGDRLVQGDQLVQGGRLVRGDRLVRGGRQLQGDRLVRGGGLAAGPPVPQPGWQVPARAAARALITLVRDVRAGMADYRQARDDYMNRHT